MFNEKHKIEIINGNYVNGVITRSDFEEYRDKLKNLGANIYFRKYDWHIEGYIECTIPEILEISKVLEIEVLFRNGKPSELIFEN